MVGLVGELFAAFLAERWRLALDFHDYDNDLMRDLDKTIKYFEPDITAER